MTLDCPGANNPPVQLTGAPDRRRHTRFPAGNLPGQLVDMMAPAPVRDISLGGFALETPTSLTLGTEHRVRFVTPDNWSVTLAARVANCRDAAAAGPLFVAGFAFVEDAAEAASRSRIKDLLSSLRYMPRLMLRPWQAPWIETRIEAQIAAQSESPVRALIDRLSIAP